LREDGEAAAQLLPRARRAEPQAYAMRRGGAAHLERGCRRDRDALLASLGGDRLAPPRLRQMEPGVVGAGMRIEPETGERLGRQALARPRLLPAPLQNALGAAIAEPARDDLGHERRGHPGRSA